MNTPKFGSLEQRGRSAIGALFGTRELVFLNNDEAINFCEQQTNSWRRLLAALEPQSNGLLRGLQNEIDQGRFETASRPEGDFVVQAKIPLLAAPVVDQILEFARASRENLTMVIAAVLIECREIGGNTRLQNVPLDLFGAMLIYSSGGALMQDVGRRLVEFEGRMVEARQNFDQLVTDNRSDVAQFTAAERANLTSFKQSLSEEVRLRSASELWQDRAWWHRAIAITALVAFFAIVAFLVIFGAMHMDKIVAALPRDKDQHIEYVSIALLAIPALAVGWCLKILARLVHTNSVLGDDSRQRQAMTRTYLALVADSSSQVTTEDRLVMLNAIFRPLPGSQSDEVAPPTILDLVNKGAHG
ncbi:DUF6161 domain-containing protein [Bradyrhizobium diazoefficiens]|uniref:DUF6161 domain-containing protein n=1 Tax=Bradyrhizobium diazoefficiens TaxID=1355477 RepID=UPI0012FED353|nr:DUF6161 domain-containing protein [Bradyrhizobium diazoefficiens]